MKVFPKIPPTGDTTYIFVAATNHGAQATTITHLAGVHYPSLFHKFLGKATSHFAVVNNALGSQLPNILAPGAQWTGAISQADAISKFGTIGRFYCGVFHSTSKKPVYTRVRLDPEGPSSEGSVPKTDTVPLSQAPTGRTELKP